MANWLVTSNAHHFSSVTNALLTIITLYMVQLWCLQTQIVNIDHRLLLSRHYDIGDLHIFISPFAS